MVSQLVAQATPIGYLTLGEGSANRLKASRRYCKHSLNSGMTRKPYQQGPAEGAQ